MNTFNSLSPEQRRLSIELSDLYDVWLAATQQTLHGHFRWKRRSGHDYLVRLLPGSDTGPGMGARSPETERLYEAGRAAEAQESETWKRLLIKGRMYKALRLPVIPDETARALRALDRHGLLGTHLRVIGSAALPAYELEAGVRLPADLLATEDMDLSWVANARPGDQAPDSVSAALKDADPTWTVSQEKPFQLRNRSGHQLDVVMAEALLGGYPQRDPVRALPTRGQELLLGGTPVSQVVVDTLGKPARLVVPDPRHFALHKLYLPLAHDRGVKQAKDRAQAKAVLNLLAGHLPHYPLDDAFRAELPSELGEQLAQWEKGCVPAGGSISTRRKTPLPK